ncbi:MAG TPA: hypothetical protein VK824_01965, partial [Planctomycetota bacterium]|nr:hypothetical protein [Planctomycetota bacterium]
GDTIVLADGVYSGPGNVELDFLGKAVLLTSAHGKEHCRIDGLHESRLARLSGGLGVQIRGLTVADCSETSGGALLCEGDSTLELSDCSFTGNEGGQGGVALLRDHADVGFTRCVLAGNAALMGGAVRVNAGTLRLESCTFWGNAATALNSKGGSVLATMGADVQLLDVILRGGTALHGAELYAQDAGTVITTSFSDVQGGEAGVGLATGGSLAWGAGTIDADPLFKGAASGDFRLAGGSPCTDSGDPSAPLDADGTRADMGAIPFVGWEDLGQALAGRTGLPVLHGQGTLIAGEKVVLALSGAAPHALTFLVLGGSTLFAPFKGGTLVPAFDVPLAGPVTDAEGAGALSGRWPLQAPHGFTVFLQAWIPDAAAPAGFSASNGLAAETR